ncbi:MAG: phosphotransferase [Planctomycetota bacterium]|nr:phosphotransferase [Planctomycetota bacterium]
MERPWTPEHAVSAELAAALIESQCSDLAPARVELLGVGWDNTVFRVNGDFVFRFPRRTVAVELIRTEAALLPAVAPELPLAIPVPRFFGEPEEPYPWPFLGYDFVPGRMASHAGLDAEARTRAAEPLGTFLAALHGFPAARARELGAPPDDFGRLDLPTRIEHTEGRLATAVEQGLLADARPWRPVIEETPAGWEPSGSTLVHGDLDSRHVLIDDADRPRRVIDWGDIHLGDASIDLGLAHGFLPRTAHDVFRRSYGPVDDEDWNVARFRALHTAVILLLYGADIGDDALVREARVALDYLR